MESKDRKFNIFNAESQENLDDRKTGDWPSDYHQLSGDMAAGPGRAGGMDEVHLGKGLIKPTKVQMELDGYHFSYEKPPQRLPKFESQSMIKNGLGKLKTLEPKIPLDTEMTPGIGQEEIDAEASTVPEEMDVVPETGIVVERNKDLDGAGDDEPKEEIRDGAVPLIHAAESSDNTQEEKLPDSVFATLQEMSESSVKCGGSTYQLLENDQEQPLLAGSQTWYGIPLPNAYQITAGAVIILDPDNGLRRIGLEAIGEVWLQQSFLMKLLGIGNLGIELKNCPGKTVILKGLTKPRQVLKTLEDLIARRLSDGIS